MSKKWKDIKHKKDIPVSGTGRYYNIEEYEKMEEQFTIDVKAGELTLIFDALSTLPFGQVALLIQTITKQMQEQREDRKKDTDEEE